MNYLFVKFLFGCLETPEIDQSHRSYFQLRHGLNFCQSLDYHVRVAPLTEVLVSEWCNDVGKCCCTCVSVARPRTAKVDLHIDIVILDSASFSKVSQNAKENLNSNKKV
jgi:hypothetical protein